MFGTIQNYFLTLISQSMYRLKVGKLLLDFKNS